MQVLQNKVLPRDIFQGNTSSQRDMWVGLGTKAPKFHCDHKVDSHIDSHCDTVYLQIEQRLSSSCPLCFRFFLAWLYSFLPLGIVL